MSGKPDVEYFTSYTGAGAARFFLALNPDLPNPSFAKIVIQTSGVPARERLREKLLERFAQILSLLVETAGFAFGLWTTRRFPCPVPRDGT